MEFQIVTVLVCLLGIVYIKPTSAAQECVVYISSLDDEVAPPRNCSTGNFYWSYPEGEIELKFRRLSLLPDSKDTMKVCLKLVTGGRISVTQKTRTRVVKLAPLEGNDLSCSLPSKRRVTLTLDAGPEMEYYMHVIEYTAEEVSA